MAHLTRCAEQFVLVGPQFLFGQIALGRHEPKLTAQRIAFGEQCLVFLNTRHDGAVRHSR
ncbi:hypothetical protein WI77_27220 [Burkholderia ubonensis]|nr:hypothetical protein WI77_27220 [Burkholderia ubonensis]